ncbi:MAG: ABC transporter ATP-binding protein [Lentisphaeria bacterium]|nr:ABC transporter ATP-binding protein [Lentisphaeria bacterium]
MAAREQEALFLGDIRKTYHTPSFDVPVLKGVNFSVWKGEFIGIMGSSGSGKSTLLNILGLLDKPTSGVYRLDGTSVETLSDFELTRIRNVKIGFVFQSFNLFPHLSVRENIEVPMVYAGASKSLRRKVSAEMAEKVRLAHRLDHRPTQLSGGECQRVAVARALVNNPTFILADEPTGNLDEKTGNEIMTLFHDLHKAGTTIVMVTHNPQYEPEYDRVIYLRNGRKWRIVDNVNHTEEEFDTRETQ